MIKVDLSFKKALLVTTGLVASYAISAPANAAVTLTGCTESDHCTLQELFDGGSIQVDDKIFENFEPFF